MSFKQGVLICGIIRQNKIITPRGADVMKVGDRVIVVTTNAGFNDLRDILEVKKEEDIHYEL